MIRFKNFIVENKPASKEDTGPFAIGLRTKKGTLKRVPDTRFDSWDSADNYGNKYHRGKSGEKWFEVIKHPDANKKDN